MPRRSIWSARQRAALFDLPTDEAALLRHYTLSDDDIETTTSSGSGRGAGDTTGWVSRFSFPPFDIRDGFWRWGMAFPRMSFASSPLSWACAPKTWMAMRCGRRPGGNTWREHLAGTPGRTPAHLRLPDVLGALRPGPEGLAFERGGSGAFE